MIIGQVVACEAVSAVVLLSIRQHLALVLLCFASGYAGVSAHAQDAPWPPVYVSPHTGIAYHHSYGYLKARTKYGPDVPHFDYVNPAAPKGGTYRWRDMGNWDSFNPIALRGRQVMGTAYWVKSWRYLWESMMQPALDEPASYYGQVAQGIAVGPETAWVDFKVREEARWHDGRPITIEDVLWTFEISTTVANPEVTEQLKPFSHAERIGPSEVRFHVRPENRNNPMLPITIGNMPILPKHDWEERDVTKTTVEPLLGSGPYKVGRFSTGRWIEWERVEDYWAKDLPQNVGQWNFDIIRVDYFRDNQVQTEALKAHVIDVHIEDVPRAWVSNYDTPAMRDGALKRKVFPWLRPSGMWWTTFWNLDQERFQDIRVREALWLLGDYPWGAARSYHFYGEATSFFTGSELAAVGLPSELELAVLEPLRDMIPPKVFTTPLQQAPNTGKGYNRANVLRAAQLFEEAGWQVQDGVLVHEQTGEPFEARFLAVSVALARAMVPYAKRMQRLGIKTVISAPEISNWLYRMRSGDFDVGSIWFLPEVPPNELLSRQFHSSGADMDYSYNWSNLRDPAVDKLISVIEGARTWDEFVAACRAFDRVMWWNYYFVPGASKTEQSMVYWDKFGMPQDQPPLVRLPMVPTWWYDEAKAARVLDYLGED